MKAYEVRLNYSREKACDLIIKWFQVKKKSTTSQQIHCRGRKHSMEKGNVYKRTGKEF